MPAMKNSGLCEAETRKNINNELHDHGWDWDLSFGGRPAMNVTQFFIMLQH
jgi:hypothetical protein